MRLLLDQNLSHRLLVELADLFPESLHVRSLGLAEADDLVIWEYAIANDLIIVTQDADYSDWNKLRGSPPKIVWIRCGNASVTEIGIKLRDAGGRILTLNSDPEVEIVEVW
jgi:predicted nuclease of predicted toxin-antitoxin system